MPGFPDLHHLLEFAQTHVRWVSDAIQPSHPLLSPFSSCLPSFPASGSFLMRQFFAWGGQSIGASASVLSVNIQGWFPLGWTGWISLQSKGFSRLFSSTTSCRHQFFRTQPSLWSNSHIHTSLLYQDIIFNIKYNTGSPILGAFLPLFFYLFLYITFIILSTGIYWKWTQVIYDNKDT